MNRRVVAESWRQVVPLYPAAHAIDNAIERCARIGPRPSGFGRNSLRGRTLTNVDFRFVKFFPFAFSKTARLDLVGEAFNLLNHTNVVQINPVFGSSGFLQPLAGSGARRIQFSLDFEF